MDKDELPSPRDSDQTEALPDTLPPPTDTEPPGEPTIRDVYEAQQAMGHQLSDLAESARSALHELGTTIIEAYQREARRNDEQDRRIEELEHRLAVLEAIEGDA